MYKYAYHALSERFKIDRYKENEHEVMFQVDETALSTEGQIRDAVFEALAHIGINREDHSLDVATATGPGRGMSFIATLTLRDDLSPRITTTPIRVNPVTYIS